MCKNKTDLGLSPIYCQALERTGVTKDGKILGWRSGARQRINFFFFFFDFSALWFWFVFLLSCLHVFLVLLLFITFEVQASNLM